MARPLDLAEGAVGRPVARTKRRCAVRVDSACRRPCTTASTTGSRPMRPARTRRRTNASAFSKLGYSHAEPSSQKRPLRHLRQRHVLAIEEGRDGQLRHERARAGSGCRATRRLRADRARGRARLRSAHGERRFAVEAGHDHLPVIRRDRAEEPGAARSDSARSAPPTASPTGRSSKKRNMKFDRISIVGRPSASIRHSRPTGYRSDRSPCRTSRPRTSRREASGSIRLRRAARTRASPRRRSGTSASS